MFILAGLGNPGEKYSRTRHNAGYLFLDFLISKFNIQTQFSEKKDFQAEVLTENLGGNKIILVKPQTYMNLSGSSIKRILDYYKIIFNNLIVIHDDLDIPFAKFKIDFAVGPAEHNGIRSIEQALGTSDFYRIRIGVDNRHQGSPLSGEEYVLSSFTSEEMRILMLTFNKIKDLLSKEYLSLFPFFKA